MPQTATDLGLTGRKAEVWDRLQSGMEPKLIADDIGVSRNSVYQHIGRLRQEGFLDNEPPKRARRSRAPEPAPAPLASPQLPVSQSVQQFIEAMDSRLSVIEQEEAAHRNALDILTHEREEIADVVSRLRGTKDKT